MNHFRVYWKFSGRKSVSQDYQAADLKSVLRILNRSHNVSPATVQELVVHEIRGDGTVNECLAFTAPTTTVLSLPKPSPKEETRVASVEHPMIRGVRDLLERAKEDNKTTRGKPHVRLVHSNTVTQVPRKFDACGLYAAKEAT